MSKKHSLLSPSSSATWLHCPGSINLSKKLGVKRTSNFYSSQGSAAHTLQEKSLNNKKDAAFYHGEIITEDNLDFKVDDDMIGAVQHSLDYIKQQIEDAEDFGYTVKILVEQNSSLKHLKVKDMDGGTSDTVLLYFYEKELRQIEVIDYKHGQGDIVEAENNSQAMMYALGIINKYKKYSISEGVILTIIQPRARSGPKVKSWTTSVDYLINWQNKELVPRAKATQDKDAPCSPSEKSCKWCPCKGQCEALLKETEKTLISDFEDCEIKEPGVLSVNQKIKILLNVELITKFFEAVHKQVYSEIIEGSEDYKEYFKLVKTTSNRKLVKDADNKLAYLIDDDYIEEFYENKMIGIGKMEKILKELFFDKDEIKEFMENITERPEGSIVLTSIDDKREEVRSSAEEDFKDLDTEEDS